MREYSRTDRVADQLQKELALLIQREVEGPALGHDHGERRATVSRDLGYADIYVTLLGDNSPERIKENLRCSSARQVFYAPRLPNVFSCVTYLNCAFITMKASLRGHHLSSLIEYGGRNDRHVAVQNVVMMTAKSAPGADALMARRRRGLPVNGGITAG